MINFDYRDILSSLVVGLEIEFYSALKRKEIARLLGPKIKKKIKLSNRYHSKTKISRGIFKLEPDFSGGIYMHELVTGKMPYEEARIVLLKILEWIRKNGWTDERSSIQANISFNENIKTKGSIEAVNRLKFILGFDEKFIYERFPRRKNNLYARSINSLYPVNKFINSGEVMYPNPNHYHLPSGKYYGINFDKSYKGYLEIRYMGGRGYEKKGKEIIEIINYTALFLYDTLKDPDRYTKNEISILNKKLKEYRKIVTSFSDMDRFFLNYPNIKLFVDLKNDREVIKSYWVNIRERLFDLILMSNVRRGKINYDSDISKFQIKDSIIRKAFPIHNIEIFDSKIEGNIINCDLFNCEINNGHLIDCNLFRHNKIKRSRIITSPFHDTNKAEDCFFDNRKLVINGEVKRGIIRSGEVGIYARISPDTEIIEGSVVYLGTTTKDKKDDKKIGGSIKGISSKPMNGIKTLSGKQKINVRNKDI